MAISTATVIPITSLIASNAVSDCSIYIVVSPVSFSIYPHQPRIQPTKPTASAPPTFLASVIMPLYVPVERSPVAISPTSTVSGNIIHGIICAPPKPKPIISATMGIRIGGVQDGSIIANIMPPKM
ncbi:unknown [Clostridium sp. CAG:349]|nr:unknown [Clostridium sp. CAG:349]